MVPFNTAEMEPQASFYVTNILGVIPIFENDSNSSFNGTNMIGAIPIFENDSNSVTPSEGIRELI
jgi:hypothetical protein